MIEDLLAEAKVRMTKAVEAIVHEFGTVRTGRASPSLLDRITVDYYGAQTPLKQLATVSVSGPRTLNIQPYDKSSLKNIEKAIVDANLGLTPSSDGNVIHINIPELTEERRKDLVKQVKGMAEQGRIAIRNVRRDVMHDLKELKTSGDVSEDDERRAEAELQKTTDAKVAELDETLATKEREILEI